MLVDGSRAVGAVLFVALSTKMVASWWRVQRKLSLRGERVLARDGWPSTVVRLLVAAMVRSAEGSIGMMWQVGNQVRVSEIHSALVIDTHAR